MLFVINSEEAKVLHKSKDDKQLKMKILPMYGSLPASEQVWYNTVWSLYFSHLRQSFSCISGQFHNAVFP